MYKYLLSKKVFFTVLILIFLTLSIYLNINKSNVEDTTVLVNSRQVQSEPTLLENPIQIQSYGDHIYFLDDTYSSGRIIKKYGHGKIYNAMPWVPKSFFEQKEIIIGFDIIDGVPSSVEIAIRMITPNIAGYLNYGYI